MEFNIMGLRISWHSREEKEAAAKAMNEDLMKFDALAGNVSKETLPQLVAAMRDLTQKYPDDENVSLKLLNAVDNIGHNIGKNEARHFIGQLKASRPSLANDEHSMAKRVVIAELGLSL